MAIGELARQYIIEDLITIGCVSGQMSVSEFVRKVYPKVNQMPTTDHRFGMKTAIDDIHQHMDNNDDWEYEYLFFNYLDLLHTDEQDFKYFLEQYVHPSIRRSDWDDEDYKRLPFENKRCVDVINKCFPPWFVSSWHKKTTRHRSAGWHVVLWLSFCDPAFVHQERTNRRSRALRPASPPIKPIAIWGRI